MIKESILLSYGADLVEYEREKYLFTAGEEVSHYFQIDKGTIKVFNKEVNGKEIIHHLASQGDELANFSLFTDNPYYLSAVALTNCKVFKQSKKNFMEMIFYYPEILLTIVGRFSKKLEYQYMVSRILYNKDPYEKLILFLNLIKTERKIDQVPYTRQEIANMTGLRLETVIRTIRNMEKNKQLKIIQGKIFF